MQQMPTPQCIRQPNSSRLPNHPLQSMPLKARDFLGHKGRLPCFHLLTQLLGNRIDIYVEIVPQEISHLGVLNIAANLLRARPTGAVYVHVNGAMAVGAPADAGTEADHMGEGM